MAHDSPPSPESVRAILDATGKPMASLARDLGIPERTLTRWRAGERRPHGLTWRGVLARLRELGLITAATYKDATRGDPEA